MSGLKCIVVTPETTALDEKVDTVVVPLFDGELGIAVNHSPLIGRLGFGELRLLSGGTSRRFYVDGGFVQVQDNIVSILTENIVPHDEVDAHAAQTLLEEALADKATSPDMMSLKERKMQQARGMMRVANKS